jgi:hypothetical protein
MMFRPRNVIVTVSFTIDDDNQELSERALDCCLWACAAGCLRRRQVTHVIDEHGLFIERYEHSNATVDLGDETFSYRPRWRAGACGFRAAVLHCGQ